MYQFSDLNPHKIASFVCCVLRLSLGFESLMEKSIDCLADIVPGRENWRIKVCVLRMWEVPAFLKPD
jgi:hypothetical protein